MAYRVFGCSTWHVNSWGFSGGSDGEESACSAGDTGLIPGSGRSPGEGNDDPLLVFLPGEFHGQRSLVGYSPSDCHCYFHTNS